MNLKKYEGSTMKEALDKVKSDLGRDGVILHTRSCKRGGFLGIGGHEIVEITASDDVRVLNRKRRVPPPPPARRSNAVLEKTYKGASAASAAAGPVSPGTLPAAALQSIETEVGDIKSLIGDLVRREHKKSLRNCSDHLIDLYHVLMRAGVDEASAKEIVRNARRVEAGEEVDGVDERQAVVQMLRTAGPITGGEKHARIVALIGPTGVGKTTTIAKLAANFKLREGLDVGLITIDTYRIAAVEQLKTYADIIGIPINVVLTPEELRGAIEAFSDKDLVLIDTAGRSQCDAQKMEELGQFLDAGKCDEVHLVVSATTHTAMLESIVERFGPLAGDRMLLTKIDEAPCRGNILNVLLRVGKAVSYVTTGQEVPDDIEVADADKIGGIILGAQN
jgi:flagellar biosynthesis protein FlhF